MPRVGGWMVVEMDGIDVGSNKIGYAGVGPSRVHIQLPTTSTHRSWLAYLNEIGEYDCVDAKKANAALPLNRRERRPFVGKSKEEINVLVRVNVSET
ncbi:hypothetical protein Pmani_022755 [Petrolisthes manimaculis]|uniref:Uncharacterized protein n=1 Tax=Petrolisthes manimaculis TaxID=1843537 RepID=A0AAE1U0U8_9EUCA|nr:hypothetical protein Pmani_022755 [Petrolisthes manimaculis]